MFSSLRARITLAATAVVALALLGASALILQMVEADLINTTERALEAELELEASNFDVDQLDAQFFDFRLNGQDLSLGVFSQSDDFFAAGGLYNESGLVADVLIDTETGQVIEIFDPFTGETIDDAQLAAAVERLEFDFFDVDGDAGTALLVGVVARDEVDQTLTAVRDALFLIVPAFAALMGLLIWWLVGRALRPVQAISDRVEAISSSSLDQRVPVPTSNDEISGLANVMNRMLQRLQSGDQRQRQFAADASHELRSPLSSVRAAAEIIERNPSSQRAPNLAADIVAEADRMDILIGDLLELSRFDESDAAHEHVPVDLSNLAIGFDAVERHVERDIVVSGHRGQLERVVTNLLNNADRHAASRVLLSLHTVRRGTTAVAQLRVEDDGAGVPLDQRQIIFERFSRLDEARSRDQGGSGLGLSLVSAIVSHHRGSITVEDSVELGGACFVVEVPVLQQNGDNRRPMPADGIVEL